MKEVTNDQVIKQQIQTSSNLLVLDFYATWCGPCKMLTPKLNELETRYPNVEFYKIDVDVLESFSQECKISAMPTLLFVKNGEVVQRIEGANLPVIMNTLQQYA